MSKLIPVTTKRNNEEAFISKVSVEKGETVIYFKDGKFITILEAYDLIKKKLT